MAQRYAIRYGDDCSAGGSDLCRIIDDPDGQYILYTEYEAEIEKIRPQYETAVRAAIALGLAETKIGHLNTEVERLNRQLDSLRASRAASDKDMKSSCCDALVYSVPEDPKGECFCQACRKSVGFYATQG